MARNTFTFSMARNGYCFSWMIYQLLLYSFLYYKLDELLVLYF